MATITEAALKAALCFAAAGLLSACTSTQTASTLDPKAKSTKIAAVENAPSKQVYSYTAKDRECLKRAMYFESKRTSEKGFIAVGSVVMNRLTSGIYPETICGVVGQKNQFAPGVMTRKMDEHTAPDLDKAADAVLKGARHPDVKHAMFFHTKGYTFPYKNMHYVASAGGNVFYEKRGRDGELQTPEPMASDSYVLALAGTTTTQNPVATAPTTTAPAIAAPVIVANAETSPDAAVTVMVKGAAGLQPNAVAPIITADVARAGMQSAFDTAYSVPQNASIMHTSAETTAFSPAFNAPVPTERPQAQKRGGAGLAMAEPASTPSHDNWAMRTADW